uniref:Recep_L_domain domain-containing protein n=1 Tax=Panagrellus redivivus TaxID=6233 RepID=A0A7E5A1B5_PANRE
MRLTKYDVLPCFAIFIHGSSDRFEQNPDNAYDLLQTVLSGFTLERTNLVKICFNHCIVDARLMRYFQHFPCTHQLLIKCQSCIIWENVNINMVIGFNVNLIDCHIQKCFFDGIVEFFNKTATTQNIKIDQSVYAITELLDLKTVNVYGFIKATKAVLKEEPNQNPKMTPNQKTQKALEFEPEPLPQPDPKYRLRWRPSRRLCCCGAACRQGREED